MKQLKCTLLTFILCGLFTSSYAQCGVDAGLDVSIVCGDSIQLNAETRWIKHTLTTPMVPAYSDVHFTTVDTGYIVAGSGIITKTNDGGLNWNNLTSGTAADLISVFFPSSSTGYVVGTTGTILKTNDRGANWSILTSGVTERLQSVFFINVNVGYAVGASGTILKTTNGGANWVSQISGTTKSLLSVFFTTADTGFIGGDGVLLKTTNGGTNWTTITIGNSYVLYSLSFTDKNIGYASGCVAVSPYNGAVIKTTDVGINWTLLSTNASYCLNDIDFISSDTGIALGSMIYKTNDGGKNWIAENNVPTGTFTSVFYANNKNVYAVGGNAGGVFIRKKLPDTYTWSPVIGINDITIANPKVAPTTTIMYKVKTVTDGCIAEDSAKVTVNNLFVNAGFDKTIICGGAAHLNTLITNFKDTSILSYSWSPDSGLSNASVADPHSNVIKNTSYKFSITAPNGCSASDSISVLVNPLTANAGFNLKNICGGTVKLNPILTNYTGSDSLKYLWSPITGLDSTTLQSPKTTANKITYNVTISTKNGCTATDEVSVALDTMKSISVCLVGVSNNKNIVIWEKPISTSIDSFFIYRETNYTDMYEKIGSVPYDSMSTFIDKNSNPNIKSNKYKLTLIDSCGLETEMSDYHKTMHLAIVPGMGGVWNLIWDKYEGFVVSTYNVYRGIKPDSLTYLDATSGGNNQYTDNNPPVGNVYYQLEVVSPYQCNPLKSINSSRSNIVSNNPIDKKDEFISSFKIFPNPSSDLINIINNGKEEATLNIYNGLGNCVKKEILIQDQNIINIMDLPEGIYFIELQNQYSSMLKKIIIMR